MTDFNALAQFVKLAGKEATMELVKSNFVKACIGLSLLTWAIESKLPEIIAAFR